MLHCSLAQGIPQLGPPWWREPPLAVTLYEELEKASRQEELNQIMLADTIANYKRKKGAKKGLQAKLYGALKPRVGLEDIAKTCAKRMNRWAKLPAVAPVSQGRVLRVLEAAKSLGTPIAWNSF